MTSLVIKTRLETIHWSFYDFRIAQDQLKVFSCDHSDFYWRINYSDNVPLLSPAQGYQP